MSETTNTTVQTVEQIREAFEQAAHDGYVNYGISMTDGYYAPEPKSATVASLRRGVPLDASWFRYNTDFKPTDEEITRYNETFYVGADWKPETLTMAVQWARGWKTYQVTGTRHAYYLLRKLAGYEGFRQARLNSPVVGRDGYVHDNVLTIWADDVDRNDRAGIYSSLMDRSNSHYDLTK
jgi:hypothetical protein